MRTNMLRCAAALICSIGCAAPMDMTAADGGTGGKTDEGTEAAQHYLPVAEWSGRLVLPAPSERRAGDGVHFEVHVAPEPHRGLIGRRVWLTWSSDAAVQRRVALVTTDVAFDERAQESLEKGNFHPERLNGWSRVGPLESLAGARPQDDVLVALDAVEVAGDTLRIRREPLQISGEKVGLVTFLGAAGEGTYRVQHFNRESGRFDGPIETVLATTHGRPNAAPRSTLSGIEASPLNADGWYVYGQHEDATFRIAALEPRALLRLNADRVVRDAGEALDYVRRGAWDDMPSRKGDHERVALEVEPGGGSDVVRERWREGERYLLLHLFGGIEGEAQQVGPLRLVTGHFSFGTATIVRDAITGEPRFDIRYHQVYAHNPDAIVSGTIAYHNYMGDLERGWMYSRPISDVVLRMPWIGERYDFDGFEFDIFDGFVNELEVMTQRYRTGNGTGAAIVTPANSCVQDSSQALFVALMKYEQNLRHDTRIGAWLRVHGEDEEQALRLERLNAMVDQLEEFLSPLGRSRADWEASANEIGAVSGCPGSMVDQVACALASYQTIFPRHGFDEYLERALAHDAGAWVLRTDQIGGRFEGFGPLAPTSPTRQ